MIAVVVSVMATPNVVVMTSVKRATTCGNSFSAAASFCT